MQQTARIDFSLDVGQVNEVVDVKANAAMLSTEDATVGTVIENRRIVELPLNGRVFTRSPALVGTNVGATTSQATPSVINCQ